MFCNRPMVGLTWFEDIRIWRSKRNNDAKHCSSLSEIGNALKVLAIGEDIKADLAVVSLVALSNPSVNKMVV